MDSLLFNKVAGAFLGTCLVGMGLGIVAQGVFEPGAPKKPGYALPEPKPEAATASKAPAEVPLPVLLAKADVKKGEADAKVCSACHNFLEGAGTKVGPDLWDVVDRDKGEVAGYDYSAGVKAKGGKWTFADLNAWLTKPSAYIPGTKMGYAGEDNPEKRAEIIVYLDSLAKKPVPLPPVTDADKQAAAGGAAAGDKQAGGKEAGGKTASAGAGGGGAGLISLISAADPKKGEQDAKVCGACHNFKEGGGTVVGPDLYGVVDRDKGSVKGYEYSKGLKDKGGKWTFADLNEWLTKPSSYIPGTKMGYPGESNEKKRAEIIAYLRTLASTPVALPKEAAAGAAGKPSEGKPKQASTTGPVKAEPVKAEQGKPEQAKAEPAQPKATKEANAETGAPTAAAGGANGGEGAKAGKAGADPKLLSMIAHADPKQGQADALVCSACHNLKEGAGTLIGPDLYGVVDRAKGSVKDFDYSDGLKAKGGNWTYADLNTWLTDPAAYIPGTKMGYPGEPSEEKRAGIIAYLRTLAKDPAPLPGAKPETAATEPLPTGTKPGDMKPPEPPNKPGATQPAPVVPEPSRQAGVPDKSDSAVPQQPATKAEASPPAPKAEAPAAASAPPNGGDAGPEPYSAPDPDDVAPKK